MLDLQCKCRKIQLQPFKNNSKFKILNSALDDVAEFRLDRRLGAGAASGQGLLHRRPFAPATPPANGAAAAGAANGAGAGANGAAGGSPEGGGDGGDGDGGGADDAAAPLPFESVTEGDLRRTARVRGGRMDGWVGGAQAEGGGRGRRKRQIAFVLHPLAPQNAHATRAPHTNGNGTLQIQTRNRFEISKQFSNIQAKPAGAARVERYQGSTAGGGGGGASGGGGGGGSGAAWPKAAWYVEGQGRWGVSEMSECPLKAAFVPLGDFVKEVRREKRGVEGGWGFGFDLGLSWVVALLDWLGLRSGWGGCRG